MKKIRKIRKTNRNKTNRNKTNRTNTNRNKTKKIKGGNNPFSDIFGMWGTMTYNLSNSLSVFNIDPPHADMNPPKFVDPSPGKQFLNK